MARIVLTGGAYQDRSLIAAAQRCVNLYSEPVPQPEGEPVTYIHFPTPGLARLCAASGAVRGLWLANNGTLFAVIGTTLYTVSPTWVLTSIGTIPGANLVSLSDNGTTLMVVNGTSSGWTVDLTTLAFATISSDAFYGADKVDYIDTFFVLNKPGTPQFYSSDSEATTFDPLYFANKSGAADNLQTLITAHREIWLFGTVSTEVWFDSGASDFPFQIIPGAFIEQGCAAKYSVAKTAGTAFWLSQDRNGSRYVVRGVSYQAQRISTFALEEALRTYADVSDAIGMLYQQGGHTFYVLTFPSADATWAFDVTTGQWHELAWSNPQGGLHRHRMNCAVSAYGKIVVGDFENGALYALDLDTFTDDGQPVQRIRSFPHMVSDGDRVSYRQFIADMEVGLTTDDSDPQISLRWSDTRGASWGNPVMLSIGRKGEFALSCQVQRLGMARDRVFELSWSAPVRTSLTGAFIEAKKAAS